MTQLGVAQLDKVLILYGDGPPEDGVRESISIRKGTLHIDLATPALSQNTGTAESPVWSPVGGGGASILHQATVTFDNDEIKALNSTPQIILPPIETLGYSGAPARLRIPVCTNMLLDTRAGAYTNVDGDFRLLLAYGSDWSDDVSMFNFADDKFITARLSILWMQHPQIASIVPQESNIVRHEIDNIHLDDNLEDDAVVLACWNNGAGDLEDGHADNTLIVSMLYLTINLTTGLYE